MKKLRRQAVLIAALVMVICALISVFLLLPPKQKAAQAMLEISSANNNISEYLDITGTGTSTTLNGFKTGKAPDVPFSLEIPNNVVIIKDGAFSGSNVVSITCQQGDDNNKYLQIGNNSGTSTGAFSNCKSLVSVSLFSSTSSNYRLGISTFEGCDSLQSISIPAGANTTWNRTFYGCKALETVNFEGTTANRVLKESAFRNCSALREINTGYVITIEDNVFSGDRMLTSLDLTALTSVAPANAFGIESPRSSDVECTSLVQIRYNSANSFAANAYTNALHIWSQSTTTNTRLVKIRGYVFCQNTRLTSAVANSNGTNASQQVATSWSVNYTKDRWYLVSYEGGINDAGYVDDKPMDFPTAAELKDEAEKLPYVSKGLDVSAYEYDINRYAFQYVHAHNVKIPSFVKVIANGAFYSSAIKVLDLSGADSLVKIGASAFYADGGMIVYMPSRQALNNQSTSDVIWFGTGVSSGNGVPGYVIMPDYAAYEQIRKSTHSYWGNFTDVLTYLVPINLHYDSATDVVTEDDRYDVEYRLWQNTYNFVEQEGSRLWDYDLSKTLPTQQGYSTSVWRNSAGENINASGLNTLLNDSFLRNGSIDLYATTVNKPDNKLPTQDSNIVLQEYVYDGKQYGIGTSDINGLLQELKVNDVSLDESAMEVKLVEYLNAAGAASSNLQSIEGIRDAGTYVIEVQLADGYGTWAKPATITVKIGQKEIDLSEFENHRMQLQNEGGELMGGTLYFDNGSEIPYYNQFDNNGTERTISRTVDNAYVRWNNGEQGIELVNAVKDTNGVPVYSIDSSNIPTNITPKSPSTYSTMFSLSLVYYDGNGVQHDFSNNYTFVIGEASTQDQLNERGLVLTTSGLSATIIKEWFIVEVDNYFTIPEEGKTDLDSYTLRSWVYGLSSIVAPGINYGGTDRITLTLRYTNADYGFERAPVTPLNSGVADSGTVTAAALEKVNFSEFGNYVNNSMPAGRYELVLYYPGLYTLKTDLNTYYYDGEEPADTSAYTYHPSIYSVYTFNVTAAALSDGRVAEYVNAVNTALSNDTTVEFDYNGKVQFLDSVTQRPAVEALTDLNVTETRTGVWEEERWKDCFGGFEITFNLARAQSNAYYSEDWFKTADAAKPVDPDGYVIYYQLSAPNWQSLVNPNTDDSTAADYRRNFYYNVEITKRVALPEVDPVTYTGSAVSPHITYKDNTVGYTLNWNDPAGYVNGGKHFVTVTLTNSYYYFLVNGERKQTIQLEFTISSVRNEWALQPVINGWTYSEDANEVSAKVYYLAADKSIVYTYYAGKPDGSQQGGYTVPANARAYTSFAALLAANSTDGRENWLNAGDYFVLAEVEATDDYTGLSYITTFSVAKRSVSVPSIPSVTYNGEPHTISLPADALYRVVSGQGEVIYAGDYDIIIELTDGHNYAWLEGTQVSEEAEITVKFTVNTAQNTWTQSPSAISWQWNQYDRTVNLFSAVPNFWQKSETVTSVQQSIKWYIYEFSGSDYVPVDKTQDGHNLKDGFVLENVEGKWVVPEWTEKILKGLDAGTWYLRAVVEEGYNENNTVKSDYDFTGLGGASTAPVPFVILVAANNWEVSPGVRGWYYGGYSNGTSITAATPANGTAKYTITADNGSALNAVFASFTVPSDSEITDSTLLDELNKLPAGGYKLTVSVDAVANKYSYFSQNYNFEIGKAANTVTGSITSWTYGATTISVNISYPAINAENVSVRYDLYKSTDHETVIGTYTSLQGFIDAMTGVGGAELPAANGYSLRVTVAESANYRAGEGTFGFSISSAKNDWSTTPALTLTEDGTIVASWAYGTAITPVYGAIKNNGAKSYTVGYYRASQTGTGFEPDEGTILNTIPADVGNYYMFVICSGVENYEDLFTLVFFQITKGDNEITNNPVQLADSLVYGNGGITWVTPETKHALPSNAEITVAIDGTTVNNSQLLTALSNLGAGSHTVVITTPETNNFNSASKTVTFTIAKADFDWTTVPSVVTGLPNNAIGWTWGDYTQDTISNVYTNGVAFAGTTPANVSYVISDRSNNTYSLNSLATANKGAYKIVVTATAGDNYNDKVVTINFEIAKSSNGWMSEPDGTKEYKWNYGDRIDVDTLFGTAAAKFGTVSVSYKNSDGNTVYDLPTTVGSYKIVYTVAADSAGNYDGLIKEIDFVIDGSEVKTWTVGFGVSSYWVWNGFDKTTNVFRGVPTSGGAVTFAIYSEDGLTELVGYFSLDEHGYVSDEVEADLKALEEGKYTLKVKVGDYLGYKAFEDQTTIMVDVAPNSWTVSPTIAPWVVGEWQDTGDNSVGNVPQGLAKYGEVEFTVKDADGNVYYRATRKTVENEDGTISVEFAEKTNLFRNSVDGNLAGRYFLNAFVPAADGKYGRIEETIQFQIFSSSEEIPSNYWLVIPAIDNWTAGDMPSIPRALPLRDDDIPTLSFTYYVMNLVENDWVCGDAIAFKDIVNAGRYRMVVEVFGNDPTNRDYMRAEIDFNVDKRVNNWTISPSIENWFLSGTPSKPVYETTEDSDVTIRYKRTDVLNAPFLTELPTEAGEYTMYVTATAPHCDDLNVEFSFRVMLSTNTWEKIPSIEDWSEEFDPNNPTAEAAFGEVVYTYFTKDGQQLDGKPTTEGTYIMRATVDVYGYVPLVEEVEFTIEPAFDMTFILIDTALAVVAVILSVVLISVIIKRRNK